jgi:hypothetical protein
LFSGFLETGGRDPVCPQKGASVILFSQEAVIKSSLSLLAATGCAHQVATGRNRLENADLPDVIRHGTLSGVLSAREMPSIAWAVQSKGGDK